MKKLRKKLKLKYENSLSIREIAVPRQEKFPQRDEKHFLDLAEDISSRKHQALPQEYLRYAVDRPTK